MKTWEEAITEGAQELIEMTKDTLDFGFRFEECFPATAYKRIYLGNGEFKRIKIEITLG